MKISLKKTVTAAMLAALTVLAAAVLPGCGTGGDSMENTDDGEKSRYGLRGGETADARS